jgi:hypothetical protein
MKLRFEMQSLNPFFKTIDFAFRTAGIQTKLAKKDRYYNNYSNSERRKKNQKVFLLPHFVVEIIEHSPT